jgi:hypothetical protein
MLARIQDRLYLSHGLSYMGYDVSPSVSRRMSKLHGLFGSRVSGKDSTLHNGDWSLGTMDGRRQSFFQAARET